MDIFPEDTAGDLHDRLAEMGAELIVATLDALQRGAAAPVAQDESKATVTRKLTKEDSIIDWTRPHEEICNLTRAMDPSPGCRTMLGGKDLKIWKVTPLEGYVQKAEPGVVIEALGGELIVRSGDSALKILELQPPGGRRMSAEEFLRGHEIKEGTMLGK